MDTMVVGVVHDRGLPQDAFAAKGSPLFRAGPLGVGGAGGVNAGTSVTLVVRQWTRCWSARSMIATGRSIRELPRLRRLYGKGRWRKMKGVARIRRRDGRIRLTELHWYEAHGI